MRRGRRRRPPRGDRWCRCRTVLVARVDLVLAHAQLRLDLTIAKRIEGNDPSEDKESVRMVRVQGDELRDVLTMPAAPDKDLNAAPQGPDKGSWWHEYRSH